MEDLNTIRAGIFFIAGLLTIIFRKNLNNIKNRIIKKLNFKSKIKNEELFYFNTGVVFIIISIILFIYSVTN